MVGNGTDRENHVGFLHFLVFKNLLSGGDYRTGRVIHLLFIALVPALVFVITRLLANRLAGLIAGLVFIIREGNALVLVEHVTIPQIKNGMTEPLVVLGIALMMVLLTIWMQKRWDNPVYLIGAGGVLGWIIMLRIETSVYLPAVGLALLLAWWNQKKSWFSAMVVFSLGVFLVAGPWMLKTAASSGSIWSLVLGREHLVKNSISDFIEEDPQDEDSADLAQRQLLPYNLANNAIQFLYYFPSNHQPLLTAPNLPDLVRNRVDVSDFEGDTYGEKYLERYVRSLPYWWDDWTGKLEYRSFLPMLGSIFLIFLGFSRTDGKERVISSMLLSIAFFHAGIYSFVGKSGGRFIQTVDWIPIIFYAIGISAILKGGITITDWKFSSFWLENSGKSSGQGEPRGKIRVQWLSAAILLLAAGLSYPLADPILPVRYTAEKLEVKLESLKLSGQDNPGLDECLRIAGISNTIDYGKALFPRYFPANTILGNRPGRNYADSTIDRVEFYLVGTSDRWVSFPTDEEDLDIPHGSEVIVIGEVRTTDYLKKGKIYQNNYLAADCLILDIDSPGNNSAVLHK